MRLIPSATRAAGRVAGAASLIAASAMLLILAVSDAAAQMYPSRPVKLMVGAPAGGGTDIVARMGAARH